LGREKGRNPPYPDPCQPLIIAASKTHCCVKMDVVRCLQWSDLDLSPCGCGLGSTPKPSLVEVPSVPRFGLAYLNDGVRPIAHDPRKGKASMGMKGALPKVSIKPKLVLNGVWPKFSFKPKFGI
jgi:hypothetical protein